MIRSAAVIGVSTVLLLAGLFVVCLRDDLWSVALLLVLLAMLVYDRF